MIDQTVADRFQELLLAWAEEHEREFPWRDSGASLYEVFMSEMFLRRTRADVVESFIPEFFERYPDIASLREADHETLAGTIRPMGLQNKRASGLLELAQDIEGENIPTDPEALAELPQVGPYVANATLCFALDQQLPIVDWNVDRIYRRLFGDAWSDLDDSTQYEVAAELLPTGRARTYNLGLLDFASMVCTAPDPQCERCPATDHCRYYATEQSDNQSQ